VSGVVQYLELGRGEPAEGVLTALAVVGPLDPDDDRQPQILAGVSVLPVEDVLL
jgi:hypothetical protein